MAGKRFKVEARFKEGDVIVSTLIKNNQRKLVLMEVVEVNPESFTNMYVLKVKSGLAVIYRNFDVVHASCRLASPAELILYGK